jgi:hypothetical protein
MTPRLAERGDGVMASLLLIGAASHEANSPAVHAGGFFFAR